MVLLRSPYPRRLASTVCGQPAVASGMRRSIHSPTHCSGHCSRSMLLKKRARQLRACLQCDLCLLLQLLSHTIHCSVNHRWLHPEQRSKRSKIGWLAAGDSAHCCAGCTSWHASADGSDLRFSALLCAGVCRRGQV